MECLSRRFSAAAFRGSGLAAKRRSSGSGGTERLMGTSGDVSGPAPRPGRGLSGSQRLPEGGKTILRDDSAAHEAFHEPSVGRFSAGEAGLGDFPARGGRVAA